MFTAHDARQSIAFDDFRSLPFGFIIRRGRAIVTAIRPSEDDDWSASIAIDGEDGWASIPAATTDDIATAIIRANA